MADGAQSHTKEPDPAALPPRTREEVLDAIDFEFASVRASAEQPGWSPWAFAGASGAVAWTLLEQLGSARFDAGVVTAFILYGFLLAESSQVVRAAWGHQESQLDKQRRFRIGRTLRGSAPELPIAFTTWSLALVLHCITPPQVPHVLWWCATGAFAFVVPLAGLMLAAMFTSLPIPISSPSPRVLRWRVAISLVYLLLAITLLLAVAQNSAEQSLASGRIALLTLALLYLLTGFLSHPAGDPLLTDLASLRREFVMDRLGTDTTMHRLQVLVLGESVSDLVRPYAIACVKAISAAEEAIQTCIAELRAVQEILLQKDGPMSEPERTLLLAGAESQRRKLEAASAARKAALDQFNTMKSRQSYLGKMREPESAFISATDAYIFEKDRALDKLSAERAGLAKSVGERITQRAAAGEVSRPVSPALPAEEPHRRPSKERT